MPKTVKIAKAFVRGVEHALLHDHGMATPTIKTGQVVLAPVRKPNLGAILEQRLAAPRYVEQGAEVVPADRVRILNEFVEERWTAVPKSYEGTPEEIMAAIAHDGAPKIAGWNVTQHVRYVRAGFDRMSPEEVQQHVLSLSAWVNDEMTYAGYYPSLPGNDVAHLDPDQSGMRAFQGGKVLRGAPTRTHDGTIRGGTEIRNRAHLRQVMRRQRYEHWDMSWEKYTNRIEARKKQAIKEKHEIIREKADKALPRLLGEL